MLLLAFYLSTRNIAKSKRSSFKQIVSVENNKLKTIKLQEGQFLLNIKEHFIANEMENIPTSD